MSPPLYPAAEKIAPRLREHFEQHREAARAEGVSDLAPLPAIEVIERIVDTAFWASLRKQEGYVPRISLAWLPPAEAPQALRLARPLPLGALALARLAPAVERPGIHLGVWGEPEDLEVWGTTRSVPTLCFVLEVVSPGLLVVKHRLSAELPKFVNVAVLEGEKTRLLSAQAAETSDYPEALRTLLGLDPVSVHGRDGVLARLAVSMRAHERGGSLLVVPSRGASWRECMTHPLLYAVDPPFTGLSQIAREGAVGGGERRRQDALARAVDAIAGLTAVDGATVIDSEYALLAFGAKIRRRRGSPEVEQVVVSEPVEGRARRVVETGQLGGMRHLSAAQFAQDQKDAVALVASQDGRFTLFAWSEREGMVAAQRLEALLY